MAKYFLALLMLLAAASGFARGAPEAETFLWQLSQPGRPVSYLLGTLHVGKTARACLRIISARLSKVRSWWWNRMPMSWPSRNMPPRPRAWRR